MSEYNPIDTDLPEIRQQRALRQYEYEQVMDQRLDGQSIAYRFFDVRDNIFAPLGNVKGSRPSELIRGHTIPEHPRPDKIAEHFLPNFYKFIDSVDEKIGQLQDEKQRSEMGFRLAVVVYLLNVAIHPSTDGNGQTSRLLALSYIHEHCPSFKDMFFPLKWEKSFDDEKVGIALMTPKKIVKYIPTPDPEVMAEEDKDLLGRMRALREESLRLSDKLKDKAYNYDMYMADSIKVVHELGLENLIGNTDSSLVVHQILATIGDELRAKYPGYDLSLFGQMGPEDTRDLLIEFLLMTEKGKRLLATYIEQGSDNLNDDTDQRVVRTLEYLKHFEDGFHSILETREVHEQKFSVPS